MRTGMSTHPHNGNRRRRKPADRILLVLAYHIIHILLFLACMVFPSDNGSWEILHRLNSKAVVRFGSRYGNAAADFLAKQGAANGLVQEAWVS
ncbi:hypothetical protein QYF36_002696 [Acer negundo]|nr:hypothetical protein QYF36_002696 [Acer negundo]